MNLLTFIKLYKGGICTDTADIAYDTTVTIDYDRDHKRTDKYAQLTETLCSLVYLDHIEYENTLVVGWSTFVEHNLDLFIEYAKENWVSKESAFDAENGEIEEFVFHMINTFHTYLNGALPHAELNNLTELLETL